VGEGWWWGVVGGWWWFEGVSGPKGVSVGALGREQSRHGSALLLNLAPEESRRDRGLALREGAVGGEWVYQGSEGCACGCAPARCDTWRREAGTRGAWRIGCGRALV
jgi:hypothetical protein